MLREAVDSVLAQSRPAGRIVIVDDGSQDDTAELCWRYVERGPVEYIYKSNGGCSSARNLGLERVAADADYICVMDSDERQLPVCLQRLALLLEASQQADFCYADSFIYDEDIRVERLQKAAAAGRPKDFAIEHFLTNEAKVSSVLYRAGTVRHRRFREDLRHNEDSDFLQRIALERTGIYCPQPASWVRWHSGSKSRNTVAINRAVLKSARDVLAAYPEFHSRYRHPIDKRVRRLEQALLRSLVMAGEWNEAKSAAKTALERLIVAGRIGAYYQLRSRAGTFVRRLVARVG
jgi:glycosyltransferase involved in cell wall biosynthesis